MNIAFLRKSNELVLVFEPTEIENAIGWFEEAKEESNPHKENIDNIISCLNRSVDSGCEIEIILHENSLEFSIILLEIFVSRQKYQGLDYSSTEIILATLHTKVATIQ